MSIRGRIDAPAGLFPPVFLLQQILKDPEGHGGFGGSARLGDHIDGKIPVLDQVDDLQQRVGGQSVSRKEDIWRVLFLQVVIGRFEQLDHRAGS